MERFDGRTEGQLRPVKIITDFTKYAEGSVLIKMGDTHVLCNATVEAGAPPYVPMGTGWVTAEYSMLPRATGKRTPRDVSRLKIAPRSGEIQRLIGRSLRSVVDLAALGEYTITVDCDVLQADGGTRCASITGGFVALALACRRMVEQGLIEKLMQLLSDGLMRSALVLWTAFVYWISIIRKTVRQRWTSMPS